MVAFQMPAGNPLKLRFQVPLAVRIALWVITSAVNGGCVISGTTVTVTPPVTTGVTTGEPVMRKTSTLIVTGKSVFVETS
jgi:hypothetical protein